MERRGLNVSSEPGENVAVVIGDNEGGQHCGQAAVSGLTSLCCCRRYGAQLGMTRECVSTACTYAWTRRQPEARQRRVRGAARP